MKRRRRERTRIIRIQQGRQAPRAMVRILYDEEVLAAEAAHDD